MTKKHYEAIACIIEQACSWGESRQVIMIAEDLADYFAQDNPKFNRDMFLSACGIDQS